MTPERMLKLADWLIESSAEEILDDIDNVQAIAEFLRDCAECEPVYQYMHGGGIWCDTNLKTYTNFKETKFATVRILYTAPQVSVVKVPEKRVTEPYDSARQADRDDGWNEAIEEVLRMNEVK